MKFYIRTTWVCIALMSFAIAHSQNVSVVHIEGDVTTSVSNAEGTVITKTLPYGPVAKGAKITVGTNSKVKLIREEGELCELSKPGQYTVEQMNFDKQVKNSVFSKFCDYFHSFFTEHSSSESKASYRNNIYAISRGNRPPPSLDFPLPGVLPSGLNEIPFYWTHACDTCIFELNIYDFASKETIKHVETSEKSYELDDAATILQPGKKYFWRVLVKGEDLDYVGNSFTITEPDDYPKVTRQLEEEAKAIGMGDSEIARCIYVLSALQDIDLYNYGVIYGRKQVAMHPEDAQLENFFERYFYDELLHGIR